MWLPRHVYERAPQFWFLLGLLFMTAGVYVGFEYTISYVYIGVGFFSVAWSFIIHVQRAKHRKGPYPVRGLHVTQVFERTQPLNVAEMPGVDPEAANDEDGQDRTA